MTKELKPCPFCGKTPELKSYYSAKSAYYFVECRNFDCSMYCYTKKSFEKSKRGTGERAMSKDFLDFILLVKKMRECQQRYFKTRDKAILIASKQLEASVDKFIAERND